MAHQRRDSAKMKLLKPPLNTMNSVRANTKEERNQSKNEAMESETKPYKYKLGRLEEFNKVIEDRLKRMVCQTESDFPFRPQSKTQVEPIAIKEKKKTFKKNSTKEVRCSSQSKNFTNNYDISNVFDRGLFSYEKVLGLCRKRLETIEDRREKLIGSIPVTKTERKIIVQTAAMQTAEQCDQQPLSLNVSVQPIDSSSGMKNESSNSNLLRQKPSPNSQKRTEKVRNFIQQKSSPLQMIEQSKIQINEILRAHAQKLSVHSIKSSHEDKLFILDEIKKAEIFCEIDTKNCNEGEEEECCPVEKNNETKDKDNGEEVKLRKEEKKAPEEEDKKIGGYIDRLVEEKIVKEQKSTEIEPIPEMLTKITQEKLAVIPTTITETEKAGLVRMPSQLLLLSSLTGNKNRHLHEDQISKGSDQPLKTKGSARPGDLKDLVAQAVKDHKIFCIFDNHWYIVRPVREELLNRGWLEVIPDRRLIPRRKPPPAGPNVDRLTTPDYAIEAIITAKEAFADDITDEVPKLPPPKTAVDRIKLHRKNSDESVKETFSDFRIVPPTSEKKKTNIDIREFVIRCQNENQQKACEKPKKGKKDYQQSDGGPGNSELNKDSKVQSKGTGEENNPRTTETSRMLDATHTLAAIKGKLEENYSKVTLTENEAKMVSKLIQSSNTKINFMWLSIKPGIHLKCFNYSPEIVNKFQKTTFCTKIGLWSHLNNLQWFEHEVTFPAKSPRMYNTGEAEDLQAFFQDFQMTACISMLKWLSETFFDKGVKGVQKKRGKVPIKAFEFAIRQCERYIRFRENEDLNTLEDSKAMQEEWNTFLQWFYVIANDHGKMQETSNAQLMVTYTKAVEILRAMKRHWPEIDVDGRLNLWIMKPYCASCGRGIFMTNNVYYISQHSKYIVQKYIEKPLLIYNTKFDIRQWFMITKLVPLEIWMYKECYLKFCTQPFALRNLHESVHLSNNSVQRKYVSQRDASLPDQNMWDSNTFQQYLKTIGQPNAWNDIIYPGMRDAIISVMLSAQETFDNQRRSWFEVYGADFMISSNVKDGPWLIEINENPAMDPSTKVTAKLCPQMLRDVIKVVVDKRSNKNAPTGQWELVYRQNYSPSFSSVDIVVRGKKITRIAPPMKSLRSVVPPPFFLNRIKSENVMDMNKQYEIVKSLKKSKGSSDMEPEKQIKFKPSLISSRGKSKLVKERNNSNQDEQQKVKRNLC